MKKITLFVIVIGLMAITSALIAGDKDYPQFKFGGRITMELVSENNMNDYTDYDYDKNTGVTKGNDADAYGQARVDLNFKTMITENICAVISTRFENGNGDKWIRFGKNYTREDNDGDGEPDANGDPKDDGSKMQDTEPKLQEAYIGFKKFFIDQLEGEIGRKAYVYGSGNVMADLDKVDGWRLGAKFGVAYFNMHYMIREQYLNYEAVDEPIQLWIWGLNGGMDKLAEMIDFNVYYWLQYKSEQSPDKADESVPDMLNIFGARGEADLMDGMLTPYIELAAQFGLAEKGYTNPTNGKNEDYTYSGFLFDIGTGFEQEIGDMAIDANIEILVHSGDDAKTLDENEGWKGIGLGNREMGYTCFNVAQPAAVGTDAAGDKVSFDRGLMMFTLGGGITPIEDLRIGLDFFMFNDNSSNAKYWKGAKQVEVSGENMWNEIDIDVSYMLAKKTKLYTCFGYIMPNGDYPYAYEKDVAMFGEDAAIGFIVGAETKW